MKLVKKIIFNHSGTYKIDHNIAHIFRKLFTKDFSRSIGYFIKTLLKVIRGNKKSLIKLHKNVSKNILNEVKN